MKTAQSDPHSTHDNNHGKSRFEDVRRDQDDQMISQGDAVLRRMHRLDLLGQTETKIDYVLGPTTAKITERCLQTKAFTLRLGEVHSPRPTIWIRQRHIRVSRRVINIPSFLVRTDREKHD